MSAPNKYGSNLAAAQIVWVCNQSEGSLYVDGTDQYAGPFSSITAVAAAVVTMKNNGVVVTSVPIPAGTTIYGKFTEIAAASGKLFLYT